MNGHVDEAGRALLSLQIRPTDGGKLEPLLAWIDTAFTGELVVPRTTIEQLNLQQSAAVMARLADGSEVVLETYQCIIAWFGHDRVVEMIVNDGEFALLGIEMLTDRRIEIDYRTRVMEID